MSSGRSGPLRAIAFRKIVLGVRGPVALPNDLAVEREILLAEEPKDRRHIHELDAVAFGCREHARIAGADIGAAGFGRAALLAEPF